MAVLIQAEGRQGSGSSEMQPPPPLQLVRPPACCARGCFLLAGVDAVLHAVLYVLQQALGVHKKGVVPLRACWTWCDQVADAVRVAA